MNNFGMNLASMGLAFRNLMEQERARKVQNLLNFIGLAEKMPELPKELLQSPEIAQNIEQSIASTIMPGFKLPRDEAGKVIVPTRTTPIFQIKGQELTKLGEVPQRSQVVRGEPDIPIFEKTGGEIKQVGILPPYSKLIENTPVYSFEGDKLTQLGVVPKGSAIMKSPTASLDNSLAKMIFGHKLRQQERDERAKRDIALRLAGQIKSIETAMGSAVPPYLPEEQKKEMGKQFKEAGRVIISSYAPHLVGEDSWNQWLETWKVAKEKNNREVLDELYRRLQPHLGSIDVKRYFED